MNERVSVPCKLDNHKNLCSNWIWVQRPKNKANCVITRLRPKACELCGGKEGTSGVLFKKTLELEHKYPLVRTMDAPVQVEREKRGRIFPFFTSVFSQALRRSKMLPILMTTDYLHSVFPIQLPFPSDMCPEPSCLTSYRPSSRPVKLAFKDLTDPSS